MALTAQRSDLFAGKLHRRHISIHILFAERPEVVNHALPIPLLWWEYRLFEHIPYRFAKLLQRLDTLWIHSQMDPAVVRKIYAEPCADPEGVVCSWLADKPDAKILVVDGANKLLLTTTV